MLSLLTLTTLMTAAGPAMEPATAAPPPPPAESSGPRWYGGPALAVDLASSVLLVAAAETQQAGFAYPALLAFALGAPINHALHGQSRRAGASAAMRLATLVTSVVILGETVSACTFTSTNGEIPNRPGYCNLAFGVAFALPLATMIVDDTILARPPEPAGPPPRFTFNPGLAVGPGRGFMSLGGTF